MLLTPENIQNQQFHVRFRGFDVDEVDTFLEKVAENYLVLMKENEKLKDELTAIQGERDQVQSQERTFKNAIISAQNIADEMQAKAQQEAHVLKENARIEAAALIDEAANQEAALKQQIGSLLLEKQQLKDELKTFLMAHMDRLASQYPDVDKGGSAAPEMLQVEETHLPPSPSIIGDMGTPPTDAVAAEEPDPVAIAPLVEKPKVAVLTEVPLETEDDDLADLYEKIDLAEIGEDGLLEEMATPLEVHPEPTPEPAPAPAPAEASNDFDLDGLDDLDLTMPDLDGDMLFSLDDPLDDQGNLDLPIEPPEDDKDSDILA